jgi:hypothetical protein
MTGVCDVPATARAVSLNVTVTGATANGNIRLYPGGTTPPNISTINFGAGLTRANNAIAGLGAGGDIEAVLSPSGTVHLVIDVNGYY